MWDEIASYFDLDPVADYGSWRPYSDGPTGLNAWFAVNELAVNSVAAAGACLAKFSGNPLDDLRIDQELSCLWFDASFSPVDWEMPSKWNAVAGDYQTADGWIRLHTNLDHHLQAAQRVLDAEPDRKAFAKKIATFDARALETAIVADGGCAAKMRTLSDWQNHPQGQAVSEEPLVAFTRTNQVKPQKKALSDLKVLDLTRILAGPTATRLFAAFGADVLRIDPPGWDEGPNIVDMTVGKRCAYLDLSTQEGAAVFTSLLEEADVLVHGYRSGALEKLGFGDDWRRAQNPGLIDIALNAYGWTGPWAERRGFDSLVQMSSGIAEHGMQRGAHEKPFPLPVQALDHATGYLMAAAAFHVLHKRATTGDVLSARLSLARTAHLLTGYQEELSTRDQTDAEKHFANADLESTDWGQVKRLPLPFTIKGLNPHWRNPAGRLGTAQAEWTNES